MRGREGGGGSEAEGVRRRERGGGSEGEGARGRERGGSEGQGVRGKAEEVRRRE